MLDFKSVQYLYLHGVPLRVSPYIEGSSCPLFLERGLCINLFYAFLLQVLYSMTFAMAFLFYLYCKLCIIKSSFKENYLVQ